MPSDSASRFQTKNVLILSGGHFVNDAFASFLSPFLPLIIEKFGLSMTMAGFLTVAFRLPSLLNPVIGYISDIIDIRVLALVAPAATAASMSLLGVAPNYVTVCVLLLLAGMCSSLFHIVGPVMVAHVSGNDLGRGMSYWMTGAEVSRTIAPLLAVLTVSIWGFEDSYPVMLVGIAAGILIYVNLRGLERPSSMKDEQKVERIWHMMRRIIAPLTMLLLCRAFLITGFVAFLPTYMVSLDQTLWVGGAMLALFELAGIAGALSGGTVSDRFGRRTILLVTLPLSSLFMLAFVYLSGWAKVPCIMFLGISAFSIMPVTMAVLYDSCGTNRGAANGIFMTINFVSTAVVTLFIGWLVDLTGFTVTLTVNALMGILCVPVIFFLPRQVANGSPYRKGGSE